LLNCSPTQPTLCDERCFASSPAAAAAAAAEAAAIDLYANVSSQTRPHTHKHAQLCDFRSDSLSSSSFITPTRQHMTQTYKRHTQTHKYDEKHTIVAW